jgi:hypothetical protein
MDGRGTGLAIPLEHRRRLVLTERGQQLGDMLRG